MATVTFYRAPLINEANRFLKSAISGYLSSCTSVTYDTGDAEVQPNVSFYVKNFFTGLQDAARYNYISYTNANVQCYALIVDVSQVSNNLSEGLVVCVHHAIDVVATYGDGVFETINSYYASGTMIRGHVNDWEWDSANSTAVPTAKNYIQTAEEIVNNANIRYTRFTPDLKYLPVTISTTYLDPLNGNDPSSSSYSATLVAYLLVYVSNTSAVTTGDDENGYIILNTLNGEQFRCSQQGIPMLFGVVTVNSETYAVYPNAGTSNVTYTRFKITNLKNSNITSMCYLPLMFNPANYYASGSDGLVVRLTTTSTETAGLPQYLPIFRQAVNSLNFNDELTDLGFYTSQTTNSSIYDKSKFRYSSSGTVKGTDITFEDYVSSMYPKLHTAPYFNLQIEDIAIISIFWDATYEIQTAMDASGFLVRCNWSNTANDYSVISTTNLGMFAPAVINDYWTRLNATQESILANINQTENVMGVVSSAVSFASSLATGIAGAATGGITSAMQAGKAIGGVAGAATGLVGAAATYGDKKEYYSNQQEIAERQAVVGQTRDVAVTGLLQLQDSYVVPAIKCQYLTDAELFRLGAFIHRNGYVTNMPLINVAAHARFNFNYVQSVDYNIGGLPLSVTRELQDLFARGIYLWNSTATTYKFSDSGKDIYSYYLNPIIKLENT